MNDLDSEIAAIRSTLECWEWLDGWILTAMACVGAAVFLVPLAWWLEGERKTTWVWRLSAFLVVLTCGQCAVAGPTSRWSDRYDAAQERRTNLLTAELRERAATAELELARINRAVAPRWIGPHFEKLIPTLKRHAGQPVLILTLAAEREPQELRGELWHLLVNLSDWALIPSPWPKDFRLCSDYGPFGVGVFMDVRSSPEAAPEAEAAAFAAGQAVVDALASIGYTTQLLPFATPLEGLQAPFLRVEVCVTRP